MPRCVSGDTGLCRLAIPREGIAFVAEHTWEHATAQVEAALRGALRERERAWAR